MLVRRTMARGAVYVLAKEPAPGRVKTRLCPPLTHAMAADLAHAFAADTLARLCAGAEWTVVLAADPGDGGPILSELARTHGVARIAQGQGDLGTRMARVLEQGHAAGGPAVLVGADTPDLPPAYVAMAMQCLSAGEAVVLGPSRDGGYYLIGAREPVAGLFEIDAPWGGAAVLSATVSRLAAAGIRPFLLPAWEDIDDAASLARLRTRLREELSEAEHTRDLLESWSMRGVTF